MIITYAKPILIDNIISYINKSIDYLMQNGKVEPSDYYIGNNDFPWLEKTLITADYKVRKTLYHLLKKEVVRSDKLTLVYSITISHPMQQDMLPQMIEDIIINFVGESWLAYKTIPVGEESNAMFDELKSISLLTSNRVYRKYHIF
ncbi:MAG: hypothetical protein RR141_04190 [Rikenellaceae bacterium]